MQRITVHCPACNTDVSFEPSSGGHPAPCPACGVKIPVPEYHPPKKRVALRILVIVAVCLVLLWPMTHVAAVFVLNERVERKMDGLDKTFSNTSVKVRAPCPFVMAYKIEASEPIKGPTKHYVIERYYFWFFGAEQEFQPGKEPKIFHWVWF